MTATDPDAPGPDAPGPDAPGPDAAGPDVPAAAVPTGPPGAVPPVVDDRRADPPAPAAARVAERAAPETEAQRQTEETVRSISRLEESN